MKRPAASDGPQKARRFAIHVKMEPCFCDPCQDAQIEALQKMELQVQQPSSTSQPVTSQSAETTEQSNVDTLDAQSEGEDTEETLRAQSEGEETEGSAAGGTGAVETLGAQSEGEETEASAAGGTGAVETMGAAEEPYEECTKVSLKETCRKYGLRIGGTVQFLLARLRVAMRKLRKLAKFSNPSK